MASKVTFFTKAFADKVKSTFSEPDLFSLTNTIFPAPLLFIRLCVWKSIVVTFDLSLVSKWSKMHPAVLHINYTWDLGLISLSLQCTFS